jgi:hypothetical protein
LASSCLQSGRFNIKLEVLVHDENLIHGGKRGEQKNERTYDWKDGNMDKWLDELIDGLTNEQIHGERE